MLKFSDSYYGKYTKTINNKTDYNENEKKKNKRRKKLNVKTKQPNRKYLCLYHLYILHTENNLLSFAKYAARAKEIEYLRFTYLCALSK